MTTSGIGYARSGIIEIQQNQHNVIYLDSAAWNGASASDQDNDHDYDDDYQHDGTSTGGNHNSCRR